jgi:hypothetical protein
VRPNPPELLQKDIIACLDDAYINPPDPEFRGARRSG